ncbi:zinc finger protein castor homolog 1 [Notechis scutatus]|uniref:Zinc finger protein castor homolog 1 n=1 Tax=Notechis scutatus TaxID=8663 RepID=A0A6J1VQH4_9SAUR|nr:zinc finger protein castor homolog 1 [Notechis scutatus]
MAAKRKGGLKLNAICAKLSRQVVVEHKAPEQGHVDKAPLGWESAGGETAAPKDVAQAVAKEPGPKFSEGTKIEEDKRREVIEKWVNGEYSEDPLLGRIESKEPKAPEGTEVPPEGVYMVQPKGCSDDEDNGDEAEQPAKDSQDGSFVDDRDSDGPPLKDESFRASNSEASSKLSGGASTGEASSLRDYAATTMTEFLGMFGYDDQNMRDELARKISFEKLNAPTSETNPAAVAGEDAMSKRARFSKYEEYIRKLKAGEQVPWPIHPAKAEELSSKLNKEGPLSLGPPIRLPAPEPSLLPETKATILPLPSSSGSPMQGLMSRASKYDFFIQKLKTGETLRPQNGNTYKKTSKYDLENVKYLHLFKPGEGSPDMGGAIAFKTGKVGRPSKYDVRNVQKITPVKAPAPSLGPNPLASTPSSTPVAGPEQPVSLPFSTPEYLKSTFSKTDSITTGTVSTVKNGLTTDKPAVTEDVNIYQKYIARFSGSQHCGHIHCAYQYREHYHCLDPECNYQRFTSKQDVIRHYNMHKKRDNSLQHGFMRFSPLDDCSVYYHGCHLNGKSTHYHCMQVNGQPAWDGQGSGPTTGNTITMPTAAGAKKRFWIIEDMSPFGKRRKTPSSRKMLDEGMMLEGFRRYDLYEDCKDANCQFSLKVTHYHCTRENCGYKFCGRTHMYKHAQHHDRVDNLVLDDFKRFKSSLSCHFPDCQFSGNSTHFHCLRCGFRCTDSTKVTAHRKHHGKQDVISAAGFCQFSSSVDCEVPECKYKLKCSHFHCTYPGCKHTVVGMSQMDSHKRKHEKQERGELPAISPGPEGLSATPMEYEAQSASVNLDSSLNLSTDAKSSLFFLQNAAGVGLNDSMDLSQKPLGDTGGLPSVPAESQAPAASKLFLASCGNVEEEDDSSHDDEDEEEEMNEEEDEDEEDEDEEDDEEEEEDEEEEDLNTDSEESLPDAEGPPAKDISELQEAVSSTADPSDTSMPSGEPASAP